MTRILIVEDEVSFSDPLSYLLSKEGYEVSVAENGHDALTEFDAAGADLVLLDLMLPGLSGIDVCRTLRQRSSVPVIMLTAKDSEIDKVVGLEIGADDYVTKPYSSRELLARVKAVLRRLAEPEDLLPPTIEVGPVRQGGLCEETFPRPPFTRHARAPSRSCRLPVHAANAPPFRNRHSRTDPWQAIPNSRTSCTARARRTRSARRSSASSAVRSPWPPRWARPIPT